MNHPAWGFRVAAGVRGKENSIGLSQLTGLGLALAFDSSYQSTRTLYVTDFMMVFSGACSVLDFRMFSSLPVLCPCAVAKVPPPLCWLE